MVRRFLLLWCALLISVHAAAQDNPVQIGNDAPQADRITITESDGLTVTIRGEAGAVPSSAGVIVRNVQTGDTNSTGAAFDGSFSVDVAGLPQQPYQIQRVARLPDGDVTTLNPLPGTGIVIAPDAPQIYSSVALGGQLAYGAGRWLTEGRLNQRQFNADSRISLMLDVTFAGAQFDDSLPYRFFGTLALRQLFAADGSPLSTGTGMGADWSSILSVSGRPVLGAATPDLVIAETSTETYQVTDDGLLAFTLRFNAALPDDVADGIYVPVFSGQATIADSEPFDWYANRTFGVDGAGNAGTSETALPLTVRVGDVQMPQLAISLNGISPVDSAYAVAPDLLPETARTRYQPDLRIHGDALLLAALLRDVTMNITPERVASQTFTVHKPILRGGLLTIPLPEYPELTAEAVNISGTTISSSGHRYGVDGRFNLIHWPPLTILPALPPGIPLTNDAMPPAVTISPARDAELFYEDGRGNTLAGRINRYGYGSFAPPVLEGGNTHYQADYFVATIATDAGGQQAQLTTGGAIIAQDGVASGVRGLVGDNVAQAWFDSAVLPIVPETAPLVNFPFFSGDVVYLPDDGNAGLRPILSGDGVQQVTIINAEGVLRDFVRTGNFDGRLTIAESGLRAGDVLWLFGATGDTGYAATAVISADQSVRVVPAFSDDLLPDRDMIVLPTGVRPGQVLETGDTFVSAGLVTPTVSAAMQIIIETATQRRDLSTSANRFGWYYDPALNFEVMEAGVYTVTQRATFAGSTSAGQVAQPVSGTVNGAEDDRYWVFVVERNAPMLETPRDQVSEVLAGQPFTINVRAPDDWMDVQAYVVARTAQDILDQAQPGIFANQTNYSFDPAAIARRFANFDASDTVTITLAMTGLDANGEAVIQARVFTLNGTQLYTPKTESDG